MSAKRTPPIRAKLCTTCPTRHAYLTMMVNGVEFRHQPAFFSKEALLKVDNLIMVSRRDAHKIKRWAINSDLPEKNQPLDYVFAGLVRIYWDYLNPIVCHHTTDFGLVMVQRCSDSFLPEPDLSAYPPEKADFIGWIQACAKKFIAASGGVLNLGATCENDLVNSFWDRVTVDKDWKNEEFPYLFEP